jgi:hypothetical protein
MGWQGTGRGNWAVEIGWQLPRTEVTGDTLLEEAKDHPGLYLIINIY